jgi:hypothetical protein
MNTHANAISRTAVRTRTLYTILLAGLVAGALDITDACVWWGYKADVPAMRILQSVASGLLGAESYEGGAATAALGLALHFFISICAAAFFYAASRRIPLLVRHAVPSGILYGLAFYFLMTFVIVPLSAAPRSPHLEWNGFFTHTILFGLPIALICRRAAAPPTKGA